LEYYHHVQEGLVSLFIQSKIITGKFKIDGKTQESSALALAGEAIPEVGCVLTTLATVMEVKNTQEIKRKLQKISELIRDDQKNIIAKYISAKLTI
jgi:hypothetical protein